MLLVSVIFCDDLCNCSGQGRYDFTHEVLSAGESVYEGREVPRDRRISIICRDLPKKENMQSEHEVQLKPIPVR